MTNLDRIKALCRLLEVSGDLTPTGTRQIVAVIEHENNNAATVAETSN